MVSENHLTSIINHPEIPLTFKVRHPIEHNGFRPPCLVLVHGWGGNEDQLAELALEQDPQLLVVLVRAPTSVGTDQYGWYHVRFTDKGPQIDSDEAERSRQLLLQFMDQLPHAYAIDRRQLYIAGFSQGGVLSASAALTRPEKVAGFGMFSGRILPDIAPHLADKERLSRLSAYVTHGLQDDVLPVDYARDALHMLMHRSVKTGYREYPAGHELTREMKQGFTEWLGAQLKIKQFGYELSSKGMH